MMALRVETYNTGWQTLKQLCLNARSVRVEVQLQTFLTWALNVGERWASRPGHLTPGKEPNVRTEQQAAEAVQEYKQIAFLCLQLGSSLPQPGPTPYAFLYLH